jgi:pyruvate dehydrogenase E2 component (dihydrolipoamide acetyltransferase)
MATEVRLPQFGMGMQEGKLLRWFKHEGERVQEGEPLCEVEAEKAIVEVPSPQSGLLSRIIVEVDRTVPVLEVIAIIESSGEASNARPNNPDRLDAQETRPPQTVSVSASSASREARPHNVQVTPLARRVAKDHGIELREVTGTGPGGRITDQDVRRTIASRAQPARTGSSAVASVVPGRDAASSIRASEPVSVQVEPRARRLANQHGIDLSRVAGTGPGGRIGEEDVRQAAGSGNRAPEAVALGAPTAQMGDIRAERPQPRVIPLTGMRGAIARRMLQSLQTSAQLTLVSEADVTELVKQREALTRKFETTYTDLLIKASALALRKHPRLNAVIAGEEIHILPDINIGVAIALDDGLVVPVVRNADGKPLSTIAGEVAEFVRRARSGKLSMAEITGGSFTVTNLGSFGIDAFTPILNPPEAGILGVGRIFERLTRRDSDLVWRQMMILSLTVDHRAVDGAPAAAFLKRLRELLEEPALIIQET